MKRQFRLENLDCANCAAKMEHDLAQLSAVQSVNINFLTTKLTIEFADELKDDIQEKIEQIVHKYEKQVIVKRA